MTAIVFDLGGTNLRCAVAGDSGELSSLSRERTCDLISFDTPEAGWKQIVKAIVNFERAVASAVPVDAPIIVSFAGPVAARSRILSAPTVAGSSLSLPDLRLQLAAVTRRRVHILNDVSAAAWHISRSLPVSRFMVVTVRSGIGSMIFDRQHSSGVLDEPPYSGEIGHLVVDVGSNSPVCDCGGRGHLGAISSGRGIERAARRLAHADSEGFLASACVRRYEASSHTLNNEEHLIPAALEGDEWALKVIRGCSRPLARALLTVVLGVGLERVVIIGGFALSLGKEYLSIINSEMAQIWDYSLLPYSDQLVSIWEADDEVCLRGAAFFAQQVAAVCDPKTL
ncbi:MAG TPA: ROK family protein [Blastocatellia bacterium]|nr:ROK family protein [Blastocatellia bacterium]